MKLHLGCGERYFEGYRNIDFPPSEHTVQQTSVADEYADITKLRFEPGSVREIRLHHVFEHFPRPLAFALLARWNQWLSKGGKLHIEVPDLKRCAFQILNPFNRRKMVTIRHLFGSHEATWAIHCEGWTKQSLTSILSEFGFGSFEFKRNSWRGTYNIEVICQKVHEIANVQLTADKAFRKYLVDQSPSETQVLKSWDDGFEKAFNA